MDPIGSEVDRRLGLVEDGVEAAGAVRLGADGVDAAVGPAAGGHLLQLLVDVFLGEVDRLGLAELARHRHPLGHAIDGDDASSAEHPGALDGELTDRSTPPDGHGVALLDLGVLRAHVAGGEDVGEEEDLLVGQVGLDLETTDVGVGHAEILGLTARVAAAQVRVAEETGGRVAHHLRRHGGVRIRVVAAGEESLLAEEALAAGDGEGG